MLRQTDLHYPTVFVIDDDQPVRDSLKLLLESLGKKVETFASAQEFLDRIEGKETGSQLFSGQVTNLCCSCLVLDIRMPGMDGLELQEQLNARDFEMPIIFITGHGEVPMAVAAMRKGAFDFVQKPFTNQDLTGRIDAALARNKKDREQMQKQQSILKNFNNLTEREQQILQQITQGKSNKIIAHELRVSQRTVEAHRSHIMEKMQAESLPHLMRMVLEMENAFHQ